MVYKEGKVPANARVDIDYSKGKPKVKFSYPTSNPKKEAIKQHLFGYPLLILFIILWLIPFCYFSLNTMKIEYPKDCNASLDKGFANVTLIVNGYEDGKDIDSYVSNYDEWIKGVNLECDTGNYSAHFIKDVQFFYKDTYLVGDFKYNYFITVWIILYIFLIAPFLIYFLSKFIAGLLLKSEKYCKWFPKAQAKGVIFKKKTKGYYKYYPKDVLDNVIVLPSFYNVEFNYKTKGDFSKYLEKIKIREYRWKNINLKKNKVSKEKIEHYKWYAIFYFKGKIKSGYLEVIYE